MKTIVTELGQKKSKCMNFESAREAIYYAIKNSKGTNRRFHIEETAYGYSRIIENGMETYNQMNVTL
jgi:hypothetical protein